MYFFFTPDDCGLCIQMGAGLETLYFIKNKSQSRVIVEVDLTSPSFSSRDIQFIHGDIRQFSVMNHNVYSINCKGILQVYNLKSQMFSEAMISQAENILIDNFSLSKDEKLLAISGSESRMSQKPRQVILLLDVKSLKKISSTVLKDTPESPVGTVKKTVFIDLLGKRLLVVITDGNCGLYLFEVKEKELRAICAKEYIHKRKDQLLEYIYDIVNKDNVFVTCSDDCSINKLTFNC